MLEVHETSHTLLGNLYSYMYRNNCRDSIVLYAVLLLGGGLGTINAYIHEQYIDMHKCTH